MCDKFSQFCKTAQNKWYANLLNYQNKFCKITQDFLKHTPNFLGPPFYKKKSNPNLSQYF